MIGYTLADAHVDGRHESVHPDDRGFWSRCGCPFCAAAYDENGLPRLDDPNDSLEASLRWVRSYAASALAGAQKSLGWWLDHLRLHAGLVELADWADPEARMMLCHRKCAPYAHFHAVRDTTPNS